MIWFNKVNWMIIHTIWWCNSFRVLNQLKARSYLHDFTTRYKIRNEVVPNLVPDIVPDLDFGIGNEELGTTCSGDLFFSIWSFPILKFFLRYCSRFSWKIKNDPNFIHCAVWLLLWQSCRWLWLVSRIWEEHHIQGGLWSDTSERWNRRLLKNQCMQRLIIVDRLYSDHNCMDQIIWLCQLIEDRF